MSRLLLTGGKVFVPGTADLQSATVVIEDGRIAAVGGDQRSSAGDTTVDVTGMTVLPGLIDAHFHLTMHQAWGPMSAQVGLTDPYLVIRGVRAALRALRDGITTVRELGANHGTNMIVKKAIDAGAIPGPRVFAAGAPIGVPGGHAWMVTPQATGPIEFARAARIQIRDGASWVKLFASEEGLFGGPDDDPSTCSRPDVSLAELAAAVEAAHSMRTPVAVHANHHDAIERSLDAGVDSIEHGIFLRDDQAARMAETGTALIPTLNIYRQIAEPRWGRGAVHGELAARMRDSHMHAAAAAIAAGVRVCVGSDSMGDIVDDLLLLTECGMSNADAVAAITRGNAELLGIAGEVGTVAPGFVADLAIVEGDPVADLDRLRQIRYVVQAGEIAAPAEIGLRTEDETPEWNTGVLAAGGPAGSSPY